MSVIQKLKTMAMELDSIIAALEENDDSRGSSFLGTPSDGKISDAGIIFLKEREGVKQYVYQDSAGYDTIGVGHLVTDEDHDIIGPDGVVSMEQVDKWLREDVADAELAVNTYAPKTWVRFACQFDALASFVFNVGTGAFRSSTLVRRLKECRTQQQANTVVAEELPRWHYAGGQANVLSSRRDLEVELYVEGKY